MKVTSWIIGILGLWIIVSALLVFTPQVILWSNLVSGIVIAFAGFSFIEEKKEYGWIAGVVGLWIFISAFIPDLLAGPGLSLNGIVAGAVVAIDGFFSLGGHGGGKTTQPAH